MRRARDTVEVLVVGGGAVGICAAYYLLEQGRQVAVVDKGAICSGSSYGNAGLIVPSHSIPLAEPGILAQSLKWIFDAGSPFYIKPRLDPALLAWLWRFRAACKKKRARRAMPFIRDLSLASAGLYEELAALEELEFGFREEGMVMLFKSEKGLEHGVEEARLLAEIGLETQVLDPVQVQAFAPAMRPAVAGGVYYAQDAHITPARFVRGLARHIESRGARIHPSTEVLGFSLSGGRISRVRTTRGDFLAGELVLAGGSWSSDLGRQLGLNLPIQPAKGYSITLGKPACIPPTPFVLAEARVGMTPMGQTLRLAGTLELAGFDMSINRRRVDAIMRAVPEYFPDFRVEDLELIEIWRGLRPCTPDGLPFLGRCRGCENLVVAAGHAMIGITLAPVTGKLVAQLVGGEEPMIDLELTAVERYA